MRLSLFVSAVLAASLFAGGAMADWPGEDGGRVNRVPVRELRVREVKEAKEVRSQPQVHQPKVRDPQVLQQLRNRGDVVDRYSGAAPGAGGKAAGPEAGVKAQRAAEKALERLTAKRTQVINCSATDDSCGASSRTAQAGAKAGYSKQQQQTTRGTDDGQRAARDNARAQVQKKLQENRARFMRKMILKYVCDKQADVCNDASALF